MNTFSSEQHVDLGIWNQTQWMPRSKRLSMLVAIFFVFVFYAISSFAQGTAPAVFNGAGDETQVPMPGSGHDYQQLLGETVNLSNGSVSFKISFPQPKARGITLPYAWTYSSAGVNPLGFEGGNVPIWGEVNYTALSEWNTNFGIPSATASAWSVPSFYTGPDNNEYIIGCNYQSGMTFTDPSGVLHNLPITPPAGPVSSETGNNIGHICGTVPQPYVGPAGDSQVVGIPDPQTGYFLAGTTTPEPDDFAVMDKSGTMYLFSASSPTLYLIEDKNGNQITIPPVPASAQSTTPVGYTLFTDTAGRPGPSITGQQKFVYTTSSTSQTTYLPSAITVDNQNYAATWSTVNVDYTIALGGIGSSGSGISCAGTIPTTVTGTRYVMTSLTLPNGQKYQFSYNNPYGLISEIIFPDGGWTQYTWQLSSGQNEIAFWAGYYDNEGAITPLGYGCGSLYQTPVLASRTVSFDGTTVAQSQSYSYTTNWASTDGTISGWSTKTTTATATDEKVGLTASAVYTYLPYSPAALQSSGGATAPSIPLEFTIQSFDWGVNPASGTPLQTVEKTWIDQFELASETTTITATGETAGTIYTYGSPTSGVSTVAAFSDMLEKDEYDYGSGQLPVPAVSGTVFAGYPSSTRTPTRKTFYNYTCCATIPTSISNYLNYTGPYTNRPAQTPALTVPPLLSSEVVENASGTIVAATQYGYDNYSSGSLSAVTATQHDSNYSTSMTARGNLTSVTRCTTLPTTTTGACSVGPTTTYNYDITGQPSSMTDACGNGTCSDVVGTSHTTTFSFSDSPAGGNPYGNSNAYLTQINYPTPANGVVHQENFQYSYTLGYLTQSSDENSQATKYYYNGQNSGCSYTDGMDRLTKVSNPDGGITEYCYHDQEYSPSVTTSTLINSSSSLWKTSVTTMDGMGHTIEAQLTSDVNVDVVNTTYDGEGHVMTVTNPHWTTSTLPTDGTTTNYYDGLGRKIETVEPDGNKVQTCYNGVASIPAVSNCNAQLGSATTGTWVDSADEAGNDWQQTTDGLGRMTVAMEPNGTTKTPSMETDYPYDVLNNLLSVTQTGNTAVDTPRTSRSFTYNNLGQLVTSFNPESGTERYTYDLNGNLVTRTSPLVNATSGSATQTLGYCYDALNRVTYKFYSGSPNCASPSSYVASFSYDTSSVSGAYLDIGRLTSESAYVNGTLTSVRTPYQYDSMGRLLAEQQTPYNPNSAVYQFLNTYDQAGDMTSTTNGFAAGNANAYSTSYTYDGAQRLSTLTAGSNCTSGTCTPFAQTVLYTATGYGPAGITAAAYPAVSNGSGGLKLSRLYDNKLRVVDHQVYTNGDVQASGGITISGTLVGSDSGEVKVTLGGVELDVAYGGASGNTTAAEIVTSLVALINQSPEVIAVCPNTPCWAKVSAGTPTTSSSGVTIPLQAILEGTTGDVAITATATTSESFTVTDSGSNLTGGSGSEVYYYQLAYNANGNIHSSTDSVNSQYGYYYDTLNRITETAGNGQGASAPGGTYDFQCWAYDGFGNRTNEADTKNGCASLAPTGSNYTTQTAYTTGNRVSSTTVQSAVGTYLYDLAGNVINDGVNQYVYDLDGRICAVWSNYASSGAMTQYVYDAEGRRVGKGTITAWPTAGATCAAPAGSGFTLTSVYLRGVSGDQDTELDGSLALHHTNIYAGAGVMASYWNSGTDASPVFKLSYIYNDWLGTKRRQESSAGVSESSWKSDPFGDYMTPAIGAVNSEANEMHLTGKERDKESGNDYFGARYYNSPMGRFMSPDWSAKEEPVPYAKLGNPQTLNLYAFVGNNPISHVDVDGHDYGQMEAKYAGGTCVGEVLSSDAAPHEIHEQSTSAGSDGDGQDGDDSGKDGSHPEDLRQRWSGEAGGGSTVSLAWKVFKFWSNHKDDIHDLDELAFWRKADALAVKNEKLDGGPNARKDSSVEEDSRYEDLAEAHIKYLELILLNKMPGNDDPLAPMPLSYIENQYQRDIDNAQEAFSEAEWSYR